MHRFVLILLALASIARAEPISYFTPAGIDYDPAIPTPEAVLGHGLGDKPVRHDLLVQYLRQVAGLSDRLTVETAGYSHEGRPILFLIATSPANHARLEAIRAAHLALSDPASGAAPAPDMPVVTWLNYGVHGAEASGMDAALPAVYHLAAAQGPEIERQLAESVILVTAAFNPDGHSRRVNHVYSFLSEARVTDPAHAAHNLWIEARTNHYWFDLNRQWLFQTQPESKAWMAKWHRWKPNVTVDYHEMGSNSTYYFHPGVPTRTNPLIPDRSRELLTRMAGYHAAFMDSEARLYYTEEGFDNYFIGKGSTYPHVNGSVGILFEAGAARGGAIETPNGIRTLADNIRTHFRTSLSSIEGARSLRGELLDHRKRFFDEAAAAARADSRRAFVLASPDRARLRHFVELLAANDIRVYRLAEDVRAGGRLYPAGASVIVPMDQPQYTLIRGMFDRVRDFEEAVFYDVSGWTLPLAFGLDHAALSGRAYGPALLGEAASAETVPAPMPDRAPYGYVFEWHDFYAPRALYRLLAAGIKARVATAPFSALTTKGEVAFERGAIFLPLAERAGDPERVHDLVRTVASQEGIEVHAVLSGRTPGVGSDFGAGQAFRTLRQPVPLLVFDGGIARYDAGETWHLLDHRMQIPVTLVEKDRLGGIDLARYTHIVLPGGRTTLDDKTVERLGRWIREQGGTLIAMRENAVLAQTALLGAGKKGKNGKTEPAGKNDDEPVRHDYAELQLRDAEDVIGGAIFASDLDITHPLAFGYDTRAVASHRNMTQTLATPENVYATVARYAAETPVLSGYASERRQEEIAGSPMLVAERLGRGSVVLFADNPNFRAIFYGTQKLFMNSLFFSDSFSAPRRDTED